MQANHLKNSELTQTAILILGAQRSGTTWLGKIFDSHPDVLYRNEPDEVRRGPPGAAGDALLATVSGWIHERSLRSAAKRPFFRKSWQSWPAYWLREGISAAFTAGARVPLFGGHMARITIPDLAPIERISGVRAALKSIAWCDGVGTFARMLPRSRTVVILRHPCGQVASVMRGAAQHRFTLREPGTKMPYNEQQAMARAANRGIKAAEFQALPAAAKYAWAWVAFNETALTALDGMPNARIVLYEDLCARPAELARELLEFAGLGWDKQTEAFISRSSNHRGSAGYYAVFRDSIAAAGSWRTKMPVADQDAVRDVVRRSPTLARLWPDIGSGEHC